MADFKYWAFITYSHEDTSWCEWLHKALETYRIPRQLIGQKHDEIEIPAKLFPVFRDREELASGSDLGDRIEAALQLSRNLIVLCSPRAAKSNWVNEEIKYFKTLGKADRVFCFIVDGEPNADLIPNAQAEECYPQAVRYELSESGELSDQRVDPLAADARAGKDERRNALLKLIAGIINVEYDELKRRSAERRTRLLALTSISLFVLVVALALLSWSAFTGQRKALKNQSQLLLSAAMFQIENNETHLAIDNLSKAIEIDNDNHTAIYRLIALLTQRSFPAVEASYKIFDDNVWSISKEKESDKILVRSRSGSIRSVDLPSGKIETFQDKVVKDIAFWQENNLIVLGDAYGQVTFREADTHKNIYSFSTRGVINDVAISHKHNYIATATSAGDVTVWALPDFIDKAAGHSDASLLPAASVKPDKRNIIHNPEAVTAITFADDHDWLLTAAGRELTIWDIQNAGRSTKLAGIQFYGEIEALLYDERYKLIITAARTGVVTLLDANDSNFRSQQSFEVAGIPRAVKLSDDGQYLACGTTDGEISVWDLDKKRVVYRTVSHRGAISDIDFINNESIIVSSWDGIAQVYKIQQTFPKQESARDTSPILAVSMGKDNKRFFTGNVSGFVNQWRYGEKAFQFENIDLQVPIENALPNMSNTSLLITPVEQDYVDVVEIAENRLVYKKVQFESRVLTADISPRSDYIIALLANDRLYRYQLKTGEADLVTEDPQISSVRFLKNSNRALVIYRNREMRIWDIENNHPATLIMQHQDNINSVKYDPASDTLISVTYNKDVRYWSAETGLPKYATGRLDYAADNILLSPSGKYLFVLHGKTISKIDIHNGFQTTHEYLHPDTVWKVAFNQQETMLASTCYDGVVRIWSVDEDTSPVKELPHGNIGVAVEFNDDGTKILTGSYEGIINVWDVNTGTRISDQVTLRGNLLWTGFDKNDNKIISVTDRGEIAVNETGLSLDVAFPDWLPDLARTLIARQDSKQIKNKGSMNTPAYEKFSITDNVNQEWVAWGNKVLKQNMRNQ